MPAGPIGMAMGVSYRSEDLTSKTVEVPGLPLAPITEARRVSAEFGELYLPVIGKEMQLPMLHELGISTALRHDRYSDFGSTTNPHIGLHWGLTKDVSMTASWGKSFRAPTAYEDYESSPSAQSIFSYPATAFASPSGGGVKVLELGGSKALTAERARTEDLGIDFAPSALPASRSA